MHTSQTKYLDEIKEKAKGNEGRLSRKKKDKKEVSSGPSHPEKEKKFSQKDR